jgi:MFS family permease
MCGLATDIYMLIVFRVFQGIGGAAFSPTASGLIAEHFGPMRDKAIGAFAAVGSAGQIIGPIIGGLLVGYLSWRWIFFVNIPIGIGVIALTMRFIPKSVAKASAKTDLRGPMLLAGSVLTLIFGITSLGTGHNSVTSPSVFMPELCAVVLIYFFVRHLRHSTNPFVPVRLLTGKGFAVMNAINLLHGTVTVGIASLVPLYAEQRYHLSALSAGTLLTPRAIGMIITGTIAALALRKTGYRLPLALGYSIIALGTLVLSVAPRWGLSPYAWMAVCVTIIGLGIGWTNPAASNASLHLAPEHVSAITGLRGMFIQLGVIFAVAITTAILNRSGDPGITQAHLYWFAPVIVFLGLMPLVTRVPEHEGGW